MFTQFILALKFNLSAVCARCWGHGAAMASSSCEQNNYWLLQTTPVGVAVHAIIKFAYQPR